MQNFPPVDPFVIVKDKTAPPDVVYRVGCNLARIGTEGMLFFQVNKFHVEAAAREYCDRLNARARQFVTDHQADLVRLIHNVPDQGGFAYSSMIHQVIGGGVSKN